MSRPRCRRRSRHPPPAPCGRCLHGFEQLGAIASHESVLILGAGPARTLRGGSRPRQGREVRLPHRRTGDACREVARAWGADDVLDLESMPDANDRVAWVKERTGGRGADIAFNCANSPAFLETLEMVRPGARVVLRRLQRRAALAVAGSVPVFADQRQDRRHGGSASLLSSLGFSRDTGALTSRLKCCSRTRIRSNAPPTRCARWRTIRRSNPSFSPTRRRHDVRRKRTATTSSTETISSRTIVSSTCSVISRSVIPSAPTGT